MNTYSEMFAFLLQVVAAGQLAIAILNLFLVRLMKWKSDVARMPLLIREVFRVHAWFISVTLGIFGVMTWRFADEMSSGTNPIGTWLSVGIGIFWAIRTVLQITYYSSSHWKGQASRTLIHVTLLVAYGGMAAAYLICGILGGGTLP